MITIKVKKIVTTILVVLFIQSLGFAQTSGLIIDPTGVGASPLDPNNDGYISLSPTGFVANDQTESEIIYTPFVFVANEPVSDLGPGPNCGFTDFVDSGVEDPALYYLSPANNFLFRLNEYST